jgi:hypothetical protein
MEKADMSEDIMICRLTCAGVCLWKTPSGQYYEQNKEHKGYDFYLDITKLLIDMGTNEDPNVVVRDFAKEASNIKDFM